MNITCSKFKFLMNLYQIPYICNNYDINCDDYCITYISNNCYCFCDTNEVYCVNRYYYYYKFLSVLLFALLFSVFCCVCYMI